MNINIKEEVKEIKQSIVSNRRDFHMHPELGFKEIRTSKIIAQKLSSYGLDVQTGVGKTGVVATLTGNTDGKTIALRADMDALPIQETGDLPFKSVHDGVMHACGHDGHMSMLLGAAKILSSKKDTINGTVKFIFQPAEEGLGGARYMIEDGVLEEVDEIYGAHLWNYQQYGTIGVKPGPIMAAADLFDIVIEGKGGHGATPHG
ncbi:MAG: peptidase M20, partial [Candidatus Marinimicrobia bacterium]|nr:peptidase M20 [Candidatus Neomarinimicrobiota bacterium]